MGDYGGRIKAAREAANMTQEQLGKQVGVTGVTIMRYEKNQREPTQQTLKLIADAAGVSVAYLEGYESMEVRAIMDAIERRDAREFERLLGLKEGSIIDMNPELEEGESIISTFAHDNQEAQLKTKLLSLFDTLSSTGQHEAVKRVEELTEIPRYQKVEAPLQPE